MNTADQVRSFTEGKIKKILSNPSESAVRASLARLRKGVGYAPGEIPDLWGEYLLEMPEDFIGHKEPSRAEWAVYIAMTMFAMHQQGNDCKISPMHIHPGNSLGDAARCLIEGNDEQAREKDRERVSRRFYPVAVASDMKALSHHLRSLVTLFKSKGITLDYADLASDLYYFQNPKLVGKIRLGWGEDFCRIVKIDNNGNIEEKKGE